MQACRCALLLHIATSCGIASWIECPSPFLFLPAALNNCELHVRPQGRYKLAAERDSRPAGEALDIIIQVCSKLHLRLFVLVCAECQPMACCAAPGSAGLWCPVLQDALGADSPDDEGSQGLGQQVVRTINSLQRFAKSLTR